MFSAVRRPVQSMVLFCSLLSLGCGPPPPANNPGGDGPIDEALTNTAQRLDGVTDQAGEELDDARKPTDADPTDESRSHSTG